MTHRYFSHSKTDHRRNAGSFGRLATAAGMAILSALFLIPGGYFAGAGAPSKLAALIVFLLAFAALISGLVIRAQPVPEDDIV
jgi:hypothetical protein